MVPLNDVEAKGAARHEARRVVPAPRRPEDAAGQLPRADLEDAAAAHPRNGLCLHHLFEAQAQRTPGLVAVAFEGQKISYAELDRRASLLARHLVELGAGPDALVGLLVERSMEMVVGIVAILKAGAAYVPIDPGHPAPRVALLLADSGATLLLTQTKLVEAVRPRTTNVVCLDAFDWAGEMSPAGLPARVRPDHLAYVVYTSGSTGRPKGVCIEHRSIVSYVRAVVKRLRLEAGMNHAMVSTIAADLGNTVLFPSLATGGCLHVISRERSESPAMLSEYFTRERIDVLKIVPSHLAALQAGKRPEELMPRKLLILGGEPSRLPWIEKLRAMAPSCTIVNHYGPTETTVGVLTYEVGPRLPVTASGTLPVGRPLAGSRVYVLDEDGSPVAPGVQGEIFIGGTGVARGYLDRPELTAERFVADPSGTGGKLYRSGDRARVLADGNVEFCGRTDDQVKIHGHRVELGEIAEALRGHPGVRDAVVSHTEVEPGRKETIAYVVPRRAHQPLLGRDDVYVLPDGSAVAHLNKNETDYIYDEVFVRQAYLRHGIVIEDGDCVVDAGANIGLFTVFANRRARNLRVVAFEPNPAAFACLEANAGPWGAGVTCLPVGLSSQERSGELTVFDGLSLLSGFHADVAKEREVVATYVFNQEPGLQDDAQAAEALGGVIDARLKTRTQSVPLRTLSSVIAEQRIARIDLLKVNVEKSELDVLQGIEDGDWPKIRQLVVEVDLRDNLDRIRTMLEQKGYDVLVEQDPSLTRTDLCYVYAVRRGQNGARLVRHEDAGSHVRSLSPPDDVTPGILRKHLRQRLPRHMVPSTYVLMESLPLTANGKVDRLALPAAAPRPAKPALAAARPPTETERALGAIWAELLKVEDVGIHDDFFELGGHSLLAIRAVSRIRDAFEVDLEVKDVFEHPTIAGLSSRLREARGSRSAAKRILRRGEAASVPLSFAQEQLWFLEELAPRTAAYHIVDVIPIDGTYDPRAMSSAMAELLQRHEALRTAFLSHDGEPRQVVRPVVDLLLSEVDLRSLPQGEREQAWARVVREEGRRPFLLSAPPLCRGTIVHLSGADHRLLLTIHHIIADEWSMELLQRDVRELYAAGVEGRPCRLPELPIQYADFAAWQRDRAQEEERERQKAYWTQELAGASTVLQMPTDRPRGSAQSFRGATETFEIPGTLVERLAALGRQEHATRFMVLEAAFAALLRRYTGQDDVLVGTPVTGRTQSETENVVGCFINTVVLRARFTDDLTFRGLLRQVRERAVGAYAHADLPLEKLVAELAPERDGSRTPLFQVMFVLHDPGAVSLVSKVSGNRELQTGTSKFDLTLFFSEAGDRLEGMVEYATDLFDAETIRRLCGHFAVLLETLVEDPDRRIGASPMLTDGERAEQREWNATDAPISAGCVHELFSLQAGRTPDRVAVEIDGSAMTYGELEERSDRLAARLRARGVEPGVLVGVFMERSPEMVVGLVAILKAGGAYVPLDPGFPRERLLYMVEDSGAAVVLTHAAVAAAVPTTTVPVLRADVEEPARMAVARPLACAGPEDLAYVIYTSGSTGRPKGVAVSHRSLVNLLESMGREPGLAEADTLLSVTTLSFDIAALELYLPLLQGGRIVLASREETMDGRRLMQRLFTSQATVMQATPTTWRMLLESGWEGTPGLKVICGGEALPRDLAEELLRRAGEVWNVYGPTETTVWSSACRVESGPGAVPIGRPIANTQMWVLDAERQPLPVGVPGELCIGGAGVARGYWQRPELTAERFVPDPFSGKPAARLYRTGDVARWLPGGRLQCLGRMDQQVKVRGFRVEPGEIEAALRELPPVSEAVVLAQELPGGEIRLVAFVVARAATDASYLRAELATRLPASMVPATFLFLDALPQTPNGKVDRSALAKTAVGAAVRGPDRVPPRTATEAAVASIWEDVLQAPAPGVDESFFDAGGHSLSAVRIVARLRAAFGVDVGLRGLFQRPTIAALSEEVDVLLLSRNDRDASAAAAGREEFEV